MMLGVQVCMYFRIARPNFGRQNLACHLIEGLSFLQMVRHMELGSLKDTNRMHVSVFTS